MLNTAFIYACLNRLEGSAKRRTERLKLLRRTLGNTHPMAMAGIAGLVRLYNKKESSRELWEDARTAGQRSCNCEP